MEILVLGGTKFFGVPMVDDLINKGHKVTIATRGITPDSFGDRVSRIVLDRTNPESIRAALTGKHFDLVYDKIAYCSNDIKYLLDVLSCDRYIYMSTTAVYEPKRFNTVEEDFDPKTRQFVWCSRPDFPYDVIKRTAECALFQEYGMFNSVAVRYPVVLGRDDYTKRLYFYVENILKGVPIYVDNLDAQMGYINSNEAGLFMSFLADTNFQGAINGCSRGTISLAEIFDYIEHKTGKKAIIAEDGIPAPYNNEVEFTINTDKANSLGFQFSYISDWIYQLVDYYIEGSGV